MKNKVYIVMLTWNGLDYTKQCIDSLKNNTDYDNYELVVVDNGSTDGTLEYLRDLDYIRLIENEENLGFVKGNNVAINQIDDGDIVLLNNDMIITQADWLTQLNICAYEDETTGIVGCRLVNEKGEFLHAGTFIYPETFWGQQIGGGEKNVGQYSSNREVQGVVFACAYIKKKVIDKIGGLNEAFFSYFEDTDYCLQAMKEGYKTICCGKVTLIHYQNVSTDVNKVNFSAMFKKSQKAFSEIWKEELEAPKELGLSWKSIVNFPTGYAVSAKNLMLSLDHKRVETCYRYIYGEGTPFPVQEPEMSDNYIINVIRGRKFREDLPQVAYGQGDVFYKNTGKYKIGFTMLETTGIPKEWVKQANMMDEVWVPSSFNLKTFKDSGVTKPIHIIPLGVDTNYYNADIMSHKRHNRFTFLSVFEWGERKAPEVLLRAYSKAFKKSDPVVLVCKIFNNDASIDVRKEIANLNLPQDGPEIIVLHNQRISDIEMPILYRSADCFVLPTRGEGWGMPILEAMACGLPTIASGWGAQADFFNDRTGYVIRNDGLIDAVAKCPYYEGFRWGNPDEEHLGELMHYVYTHQDEAAQMGQRAAMEAKEKWSWDNAADQIIERLKQIKG